MTCLYNIVQSYHYFRYLLTLFVKNLGMLEYAERFCVELEDIFLNYAMKHSKYLTLDREWII